MHCEVNGSRRQPELTHQVLLLVFSLPTICIGLVLNGVALYIICCKIKKRTKSIIYMANLVFSDIFLLFSLPFKVYAYYVREEWHQTLGKVFCQFLESLCFVNTYVSILSITVICLDRYMAIKYPFVVRAISSPMKTALICAGIWICVCSGSIYIYFTSHSESCFYNLSSNVLKMEFIGTLEILFLICAFFMIFCSVQIIHSLKVQACETRSRWADKSAKIVLSNLLTFLVCFTPYHTGLLLYSLAINDILFQSYCDHLRSALHFCLYLANVNCCLDAIYYFYGIKELCQSNSSSRQTPNSSIQMGTCEILVDTSMGPPLNSQVTLNFTPIRLP